MPKGGNCTQEGYNCAIYDSKGNPGSHRCRALKGVPEDDNCVCNPPSATRSGARCAFKKDRNERRRDDRAAKKEESKPSPVSFLEKLNKHLEDKKKTPPKLSPLQAMYASLQMGVRTSKKPTTVKKVNRGLSQALVKEPTLKSSPKEMFSVEDDATVKQEIDVITSPEENEDSISTILPEPSVQAKKRGPARGSQNPYSKFAHEMTQQLIEKGVTSGKIRKEIVQSAWRASNQNPKSKAAPTVVETKLVSEPDTNVAFNPNNVIKISRSQMKPVKLSVIKEESNSPKDAALAGLDKLSA